MILKSLISLKCTGVVPCVTLAPTVGQQFCGDVNLDVFVINPGGLGARTLVSLGGPNIHGALASVGLRPLYTLFQVYDVLLS